MDRSPSAVFEVGAAAFEQARARLGGIDRYYHLDDAPIRIRFAGAALVPLLTRALEHLATGPSPGSELTILVWDARSAGISPASSLTGVSHPAVDGRLECRADGDVSMCGTLGSHGLSLLSGRRGTAVFCVRDRETVNPSIVAAPFLHILHMWARGRGGQIVHAGAVGTASGGVLLVGKGGSGKSTTALACMSSELRWAADDYCLVRPHPRAAVTSLYSSAKISPELLGRLPRERFALAEQRHEGKAILLLHPDASEVLIGGFPLRALLVVRVTGRAETTLRAAGPASVLQELAPSTILQLKGADARDFKSMAELTRQVPGHWLDVGTDWRGVRETVARLLNARAMPAPPTESC